MGVIFLLLLPGFYLYSTTSKSIKLKIPVFSIVFLAPYFGYGLPYQNHNSSPASSCSLPSSSEFWYKAAQDIFSVVVFAALAYTPHQHSRYARINDLKQKFGFTDDPETWKDMTVEQAQEVESNMAEWEFPRLFQFAWISDFLRVRDNTAPI